MLAAAVLLGIALAAWITLSAAAPSAAATPGTSTATTTGAVDRTAPDGFYRDGRQAPPALPLPPRPQGRTPLMG